MRSLPDPSSSVAFAESILIVIMWSFMTSVGDNTRIVRFKFPEKEKLKAEGNVKEPDAH